MKTEKSLGFEVKSETVQVGNHTTDNVGLVAYNESQEWVLPKIMGKQYKPFYNAEFEQLAHDMANTLDLPQPEFLSNNDGSKVVATIQNPEHHKVGLANDIDIQDNIVLLNPHNGGALNIGTSNMIIRCTNQESEIFGKVKVTHSGDLNKKVMNFKREFERYNEMRNELYANFNKLAQQEVSRAYCEQFAYSLHSVDQNEKYSDISKRKQNLLEQTIESIERETNDIGLNGFGLFNGITHFTTHKYQSGRNAEHGNLFGQAYNYNQYALSKLNKELA